MTLRQCDHQTVPVTAGARLSTNGGWWLILRERFSRPPRSLDASTGRSL